MLSFLFSKPILSDPRHYATKQMHAGPPIIKADASRLLKSYDYVIVGGGTAGCVLANRLTEDASTTVLLLEAGQDQRNTLESKAPLLFPKLFHTNADWNYYTVPQARIANRQMYWPRGRMLGGCSSINAMMYHHCDPHDFDEWESKFGCQGWSYKDLQPYFRKSSSSPNAIVPPLDNDNMEDKSGNALQTGFFGWTTEIIQKGFVGACERLGIPFTTKINTSNGTTGVARIPACIDSSGQRCSTATAYLTADVVKRANLTIAVGALVTRVLFDVISTPDEPNTIGVELQTDKDGPKYEVHARKEVILCAGAVNTPQTLLLSGIGPKIELDKHLISVIRENEQVGKNLKDHLSASGFTCKAKPGFTLDYMANNLKALPSLARWFITGGGPLSSNLAENAAFIRSVDLPFELPAVSKVQVKDYSAGGVGPDIEIIGAPIAYIHHGEQRAPGEMDAFGVVPIGLRPQSSGTITLKNTCPFQHPLIDPRYLSDSEDNDRAVLLVGLRTCLELFRQKALQPYLEPVEPNDDPTSEWWPYSATDIHAITDEQLYLHMCRLAFTLYHPVGTARMGNNASNSVVDLQGCVHGIKGLRIVDASIFPEQISGHPAAVVVAIAERMADIIRGNPVL